LLQWLATATGWARPTQDAAVMVIAAMAGDGDGVGPTDPTDPTMSDMSMVSYVDMLLGMDDVEILTTGDDTGDDAEDYTTSMLISTADSTEASYGTGIYSHSSAATGEYAGKDADSNAVVDLDWSNYGVWGAVKEAAFGSEAITYRSFAGGVEADAPTGPTEGSAVWTGTFVGHHNVANEIPDGTDDDIMAGDAVSGRARLDVEFSAKGVGTTLDATFDKFGDDRMHVIPGVEVRNNGSFSRELTTADANDAEQDISADNVGSMIDGQFVGTDSAGSIGTMTLTNSGSGEAAYTITGAFGAGRNQ
jgi:hypothetical protein